MKCTCPAARSRIHGLNPYPTPATPAAQGLAVICQQSRKQAKAERMTPSSTARLNANTALPVIRATTCIGPSIAICGSDVAPGRVTPKGAFSSVVSALESGPTPSSLR